MNIQDDSVQPPCLAAWLVMLFTPADKAEVVLGDLLEEFRQMAVQSGSAQRWYWRHSAQTIVHLFGSGLRSTPLQTAAAVIAGYFLRVYAFRWHREALEAVLERYRIFESHPDIYLFWLTSGREIGEVILAMLIGMLVAAIAKGREMTATVLVALAHSALFATSIAWLMASHHPVIWKMQAVYLAFSLATIAGGAIVRMIRSRGLLVHAHS